MNQSRSLLKPDVLVFCRDYLVPDFREIVGAHEADYTFHYLTDGTCSGIADTKQRFYARLNTARQLPGWSDEDENNAIARCRLLRGLPKDKALRMLRSMGSVLQEEIDRINPLFVFGQMVDEYITYLLSELARRRGIKYLGVCYSYFPNRMQVTEYWNGVPHNFRPIPEAESLETLAVVSQRTFRQDYLQKDTYTWRKHLVAVARYRLKQIVFPLLAMLKRDPLNIHYACLPFVVERRHLADFPSTSDFHVDWQEMAGHAVAENAKPVAYMPLGYFPESTIDYWIANKKVIDYERIVVEICRRLTPYFTILVKEHLHMLGARSPRFYRELISISGVISIPPAEFSHDASALADVVVIGGGSIGVESFVRGRPVASFCDTSYWFKPSGAKFLDLSDVASWPVVLQQLIADYKGATDREQVDFLKECLQSTVRVGGHGKVWAIPVPEDIALLFGSI